MKHTIHNIEGFDVIAFNDAMTNHGDGRAGDASYAVSWANENKIGGHEDWILPIKEVLIALHGISDGKFVIECTWSSSHYVGSPSLAWLVDFGFVSGNNRNLTQRVRLVRASQCFDIGMAGLRKALGNEAP